MEYHPKISTTVAEHGSPMEYPPKICTNEKLDKATKNVAAELEPLPYVRQSQ
uniref:Uncharacterized protein n=1 Tax=Arion vulgaris TaxID=1028688 RepID=A0A0B6ZN22_9EUPU